MVDFMFKTRGMTNPRGKTKIYFTCHPDDFELTFDKICDDILGIHDCAIYYTEKMDSIISEDDLKINFDLMNLFVIPITSKLLKTKNRAIDLDFQYAKNNGIPVLPIMFEPGLDELYADESRFGELQYINPFSTDPTEISYYDKLRKYLETLFVSGETVERVQKEFDAHIFLSYRKKDRFYANELMRLIHSNRACRDIAIWYDEFLTPGERFNENITKILKDSNIFTLLVTPNLLEEPNGKPNFVMGNEYPAAKEIGLQIVPAEMEYTDKDLLIEKFTDIPECIDPRDKTVFKEYMIATLSKLSITTNDDNPEHNYLIGLAYRDGIDVEIDRPKGLDLIKEAANAGWSEAAKQLALMYYYGLIVEKDYTQAAYWQNKYVEGLRQDILKDPSSSRLKFDLIDAIRFETEICRNGTSVNNDPYRLIKLCEEALDLCEKVELTDDYASSRFIESKLNTLRSLAILHEFVGNYDKAFATYDRALDLWTIIQKSDESIEDPRTVISNKWRIAQVHHDMGILLEKKADYSAAVDEFEKACLIYQEISLDNADFIPIMIGVYNATSHSAAYVNVQKADKYSQAAVELSESLYNSNNRLYDLIYAKALLSRTFVLSELATSDFDELENLCEKAVSIFEVHKHDGSLETLFDLMNASYKLAGIYRRRFDIENADKYYSDSVDVANMLVNSTDIDTKESIAHLSFDYGTFLIGFSSKDIDLAIEYLNRALKLFEEVSEFKPKCRKYVDEAADVIKRIETLDVEEINAQRKNLSANDTDKVRAYYQFQYFFERGAAAEQSCNYEKAILYYESVLEQIEILESVGAPIDRMTIADIHDRMAYCYEMQKIYDKAKLNYAQAVLLATSEAKEAGTSETYASAINYVWKLASFCEEFGDKEEAKKHYEFREFLMAEKSKLFGEKKDSQNNVDDESFLSEDFRKELEEAFERLDFTPTTFSDEDDSDYSEGLFTEEEDDISALFNSLFGNINGDDEDEDSNVITLTDEDGKDVDFEFVDVFEYQDQSYAVLFPCDKLIHGLVIMRIDTNDDDEEDYEVVDDDSLLSVLFEIFKERNKDKYNFGDE